LLLGEISLPAQQAATYKGQKKACGAVEQKKERNERKMALAFWAAIRERLRVVKH